MEPTAIGRHSAKSHGTRTITLFIDGTKPTMPHKLSHLHVALVLLSCGAGAADAFAFLALNGTFTANMTGNLVLAALFSRPDFATTLLFALIAVAAFAAVLYMGFRATRTATASTHSPRRLTRQLLIPSLLLQFGVVALWLILGSGKDSQRLLTCVVIALSAGALALQTVAAKKLSDIGGVTTTYVTGTLTTTMQALAERQANGQIMRVLSILALPAGAVACTALYQLHPTIGPILAFVLTAMATGIAYSVPPVSNVPVTSGIVPQRS